MRNSNPNNDVVSNEPETADNLEAYAKELMGTDAQDAITPRTTTEDSKSEEGKQAFRDQVNSLIREVTVDETTGKIVYPDNTPEELRYAVAAEKRFRDTQAGFTKGQQSLKEVEAENKALREQLTKNSTAALEISSDKVAQLDELKYTDPEQWRLEMNKLETEHSQQVQNGLKEQMGEVRTKAGYEYEMARRVDVLKSFNEGRAVPVTASILDNDIPPRISKRLTDGLTTFEGYLAEVSDYITKGKVVVNEDSSTGTSLNSGAGSSTKPSVTTGLENEALDYSNVLL